MKLILASASPRRKQLLSQMGYTFTVLPSDEDESPNPSLTPCEYAEGLATQKSLSVSTRYEGVVIGADTIVVFNGQVLGKPTSVDHARQMLGRLSGNRHEVITGYCLSEGGSVLKSGYELSTVYFNSLSAEQIEAYVSSGKCMDKAGAYGVQDGYGLVNRVEGSMNNVIGFPTEVLSVILKEMENGR